MGTLLYLATGEGVVTVKSNGKDTWEAEQKGLSSWDINEIAVEPSAPARVYAGTRGDGVWRSDDFGDTWTKPNRGKPGPGKVKCVTIDPHDSDTVWAGTEPIGLWVSRDACESWSPVDSVWDVPEVAKVDYPVPAVEPHVRDIVIDPKDRDTIYLALQVGFMLKSTDGGKTWKLLSKNVDADAHTIVSRHDDPSHLYLSTGGHSARAANAPGRALYQSEDGGESWSPMGLEFDQEYSVPLVQHPTHPDILYSALAHGQPSAWRNRDNGAQATMIRSDDGGKSWRALNTAPEVVNDFAASIALDPDEPDNVFVATRTGKIFRSADGGNSWASLGVKVRNIADMRAVHV